MKSAIFIILLATSVNTMAEDYGACVVLKKACISFVELTTEKMSLQRRQKKKSCTTLKEDCNANLDAILNE